MPVPAAHHTNGHPVVGPWPEGYATAILLSGCFWGAEQLFWQTPGVWSNRRRLCRWVHADPTYEEVCSGRTGHAEAVLVVFDPQKVSYEQLLKVFWEGHDPTQGMRQGNDTGTQYRSRDLHHVAGPTHRGRGVEGHVRGASSRRGLRRHHHRDRRRGPFYYAEPYHQQYLAKNPNGYCGLGETVSAVPWPIRLGRSSEDPEVGVGATPRRGRPEALQPPPAVRDCSSRPPTVGEGRNE